MLHQIRTLKYCIYITLLIIFSFVFITHSSLRDITRWNFSVNEHPTTIYPYIAVIVDDRATIQLVTAVLNVLQHIPSDWKVQIFTLDEHWPFYQQSPLASFIRSNRIFMTPIDFPRNNRSGADFINLCLTSPSLWRQVQGEKVLLFQIDSAICSNSSYKLTDFLHYDFIGAPWKEGGCCNGGFSIRTRSKTLLLLESEFGRYPLHQLHEDGWFTNNLRRFGGVVAPISVAKTFSVETIYHYRPFAVHKPYLRFLGRENMNRLCNECPETKTISTACTEK